MTAKNFYLTTPLYYVNDIPHIGHAYTTTLADVISRYHKLYGYDVFMMTGTDEHGQKVQQAAAKREVEPQAHVDEYNMRFKELWKEMNIDYDFFIRTTQEDHKTVVKESLQKLYDQDLIYSELYAGWYSVGEERFFGEEELVDGKDPISGREVEWIEEKNYFFKMSQYQKQLIEHIENNKDFIVPEFRANEILGFLKNDLRDLCISRPKARLSWGIPLPFDEDYVTYVWFDALLNYFSGVKERQFKDGTSMWPANFHLIGKDILTTHCVYWTTMLMALEIPLPKHILAHGWWLNGGAKMSKSSGTAIDPIPYMEKFGVDSFRYYVIRDMVLGNDASFTDEAFERRINSELANDLGNGLNRVHKLLSRSFDNIIPEIHELGDEETELKLLGESVIRKTKELVLELKLSQAIEEIFVLVRAVNKYLEVKAPWKLAKDESARDDLARTLVISAEAMAVALKLLGPVMPEKSEQGLAMLGLVNHTAEPLWGMLQGGLTIGEGQALFPRIELVEKPAKGQGGQGQPKKTKQAPQGDVHPLSKIDLKVAQIVGVNDHPEADSLYVLQVDDGEAIRQVCAGLKSSYEVSELQDRKVVLFANLKPSKLRGLESKGMLLAGDGADGKAKLLNVGDLETGTELSWGKLDRLPKAKASIKDYDKTLVQVKDGKVVADDKVLHFGWAEVTCEAPEGAEIR